MLDHVEVHLPFARMSGYCEMEASSRFESGNSINTFQKFITIGLDPTLLCAQPSPHLAESFNGLQHLATGLFLPTVHAAGSSRQHQPEREPSSREWSMHDDVFIDPSHPEHKPSVDKDHMFAEDDIKVEHHPKVASRPRFMRLRKFEVTKIALEAALNNEQTNWLTKICHQCAFGKDKFTFKNHKNIHKKWDAASQHVTGVVQFLVMFMKEVISMMYEDKSWDFEHLSKFDGINFVRFMDEPYTAEAFWDFQSQLPEGAKPLTFILYADKTKLSSSGAAKAYPVIAWLVNLPTDICNGEGIGGGYVVGWLPIVKEDKEFAKKPGWLITRNNVHRALSYDKLHFRDGGLFDDHLWVKFQKFLNGLGRDTVSQIDKRFKEFLCWCNQKHPNQVMDIAFTDSSIPENILKMIPYAAHDVVTKEDCPLGYLLLRCIFLYIEVDMYASLEVHTSNMVREGRNVVEVFSVFLKQYIDKIANIEDKGWNFPKLHMDVHLFDDIEILHVNHWQLVVEDIHRRLSDFDEYHRSQAQNQSADDALDAGDDVFDAADDLIPLTGVLHVKVGSKQPPQTFDLVENVYRSDNTFSNFHTRLNDFLNDFLPASNIPLPQGKQICLRASDEITEFRFLKVDYESMVDWQQHTD
ncbi:uncharacterized protein EDB91DRAFT_1080305 [Suillus paluster]|uniref:uncharacterized protein n=1 Tax=Suillus paluster TaxID=48578 RepID=UPI001B867229|nr:uncharacterized protein EDB91DRAFT_1080305 [Suillus paluster]KAG1745376.1 hypothetical protein EDB91DRAFT_1080305 [Suillus paluster]